VLEDNLFTLVHKDESTCKILLATKEHDVFKAHFEGNPLLPGFLQIDIIASIYKKVVSEIVSVKYMEPILPNSNLTYLLKTNDKGVINITLNDYKDTTLSTIKLKWHNV